MYEFNITLNQPFKQAMETVKAALMEEKLGVVSEIDVQAVFKKKMDKDIPPYRILGACNPMLADRVIAAEPNSGSLLPCNVVVRDAGEDKTVVSFMDPETVLNLSDSSELHAVGQEAKQKLLRVAEKMR